jgi:hypothetical protein
MREVRDTRTVRSAVDESSVACPSAVSAKQVPFVGTPVGTVFSGTFTSAAALDGRLCANLRAGC